MNQRAVYNSIKYNNVSLFNEYCREYNPSMIRFLRGRTILHIAAFYNRHEIIRISNFFCDLTCQVDFDGKTPLLVAASKGHDECISLLLNRETIDLPDNNGMTPLMYFYRFRKHTTARYLIINGADCEKVSTNGYVVPLSYIYRLYPQYNRLIRARRVRRRRITTYNSIINDSPAAAAALHRVNNPSQSNLDQNIERGTEINVYRFNLIPNTALHIQEEKSSVEILIPNHFKNEFIEMSISLKKTCPICLELFENEKTVFTKCSHLLCSNCFNDARVVKCPLCRLDIK